MIKLLRVDHRMLHGQVVFSWTQYLGVDCILIANDNVAIDELKKTTFKLAKPHGIKLVMKSIDDSVEAIISGVTDSYQLLIITESIEDAYQLAKKVDQIKEINLGGIKEQDGMRAISKVVYVSKEDEEKLKELAQKGIEIGIQQVPLDPKINIKDVL